MRHSTFVGRLAAAGATFVILAVLGLVLPLSDSVVPTAASYGFLTGGLLILGASLVIWGLRRKHA